MFNFLNIRTAFIFIFSIIAIYIMYLKAQNEALKVNLDIQRDLHKSTIEAYEKKLKFLNSKSTFEKENLNNITNNIKAKSITQQENSKRGLLDEVSNSSFTIVSF